jgi:antitoxin MazE
MTTTIQKWGNSLGIRIPKNITENLGLQEGSGISIYEKNGFIILEKNPSLLDLKKVMKNYKPETYYKEIDWGDPIGKELW